MSISNGQPVNATTDNTAFISRTTDSDTVGKIDLLNTDTESGDNITNIQKVINNNRLELNATALIAASGTLSLSKTVRSQYFRVEGDGGSQTMNSLPFGSDGDWLDGTLVILVGTNASNKVTIQNNDVSNGIILNGDAELALYYKLALRWDATLDRFIEEYRNF